MASSNGPSSTIPSLLTDSQGTVYTVEKELGAGVEGAAYLGRRESDGFRVVIKHPKNLKSTEEIAAFQRERICLDKEGMLVGMQSSSPGEASTQSYMIIPYFPGIDLRHAVYELKGLPKREVVSSKKPLAPNERDLIAYELLKDAYCIQQSNIVHCDIKPDNIMVDIQNGIVKIIDMGQAYIAGLPYSVKEKEGLQDSPHYYFEGPGYMYMVPESYEKEGTLIYKNTFGTDLYSIGMIIASLYSDSCYERDAARSRGANPAITAREGLADILDSNVKSKPDMPEDLFHIVRHITQINPLDRPSNVACANGIELSEKLRSLVEMQKGADELRAQLMALAAANNLTDSTMLFLLESITDLPTLRNGLNNLDVIDNAQKDFIKDAIGKIDGLCQYNVKLLQDQRLEKILEATKYERTTHIISNELLSMANNNRKEGSGIFSKTKKRFSPVENFNAAGKLLMDAVTSIKQHPQYPNIPLNEMTDILDKLYSNILHTPKINDKAKELITRNIAGQLRTLKTASPEMVIPKPRPASR